MLEYFSNHRKDNQLINMSIFYWNHIIHCVKYTKIRALSDPHFPAYGKYRKIRGIQIRSCLVLIGLIMMGSLGKDFDYCKVEANKVISRICTLQIIFRRWKKVAVLKVKRKSPLWVRFNLPYPRWSSEGSLKLFAER